MAPAGLGYRGLMGPHDLVMFLGERHLDRSEIPPALEIYVDDALTRGLVLEDCRHKLAALA
jgi:hypothetical protein